MGGRVRKLAALLLLAFLAFPGAAAANGGVTGLVTNTVNGATGTVAKVTDPVTTAAKLPSVRQVPNQATPVVKAATQTVDRAVANTAAAAEPVTRTVKASTSPVTRTVTGATSNVTRTVQRPPANSQRDASPGVARTTPVTRRVDTARTTTGAVAPTAVGSLLDPKTGIGAAVGALLAPNSGLGSTVGALLDPEGGLPATLVSVLGLDDPLDPVGSLLRGLGLVAPLDTAAPRAVSAPAAPALQLRPPTAFTASLPSFGEGFVRPPGSEGAAAPGDLTHASLIGSATAGESFGPLSPLPALAAPAATTSVSAAEPSGNGPQGPSLPDLPAAPAGGAATASSALLFAGLAALFGAFALLFSGYTRTLHTAPAFLRPAPFICLLERPG